MLGTIMSPKKILLTCQTVLAVPRRVELSQDLCQDSVEGLRIKWNEHLTSRSLQKVGLIVSYYLALDLQTKQKTNPL